MTACPTDGHRYQGPSRTGRRHATRGHAACRGQPWPEANPPRIQNLPRIETGRPFSRASARPGSSESSEACDTSSDDTRRSCPVSSTRRISSLVIACPGFLIACALPARQGVFRFPTRRTAPIRASICSRTSRTTFAINHKPIRQKAHSAKQDSAADEHPGEDIRRWNLHGRNLTGNDKVRQTLAGSRVRCVWGGLPSPVVTQNSTACLERGLWGGKAADAPGTSTD